MKPDNTRHYSLALSGTTSYGKNVFSRKFHDRTHDKPLEDTQELARLNKLASEPPFCAWQRQKNNDPL
jgi:hypothetical protein